MLFLHPEHFFFIFANVVIVHGNNQIKQNNNEEAYFFHAVFRNFFAFIGSLPPQRMGKSVQRKEFVGLETAKRKSEI